MVDRLSKAQAERIADDVLQLARTAENRPYTHRLRRLPKLCRCRELDALPPWAQAEVLRRADREVFRSPGFIIGMLAWIAGLVALWMLAPGTHGKSGLLLPIILAGATVPRLLRTWLLRPRVRKIAMDVQAIMAGSPERFPAQ